MATILIVEDDPPVRALMRAVLTLAGHRVSEVADAEAALQRLGREPFDIMLLDLMLPAMSGHELLERMQALPGTNETKVVVVSALDDGDGRGLREAMLGVLAHITKPFGSREIEDAVREALSVGVDARREQRRRAATIYYETFEVAKKVR